MDRIAPLLKNNANLRECLAIIEQIDKIPVG